jgi:hypothetical protein
VHSTVSRWVRRTPFKRRDRHGAWWLRMTRQGLLKPPQNMKLLPLPPYAPELNPMDIFGTNCMSSTSITVSSIILMSWRTNSKRPRMPLRATHQWCSSLRLGNELLLLYWFEME